MHRGLYLKEGLGRLQSEFSVQDSDLPDADGFGVVVNGHLILRHPI